MDIWTKKPLSKAAVVIFSLVTGIGAAFAQDSTPSQDLCEGYYIEGGTFDSLTLNGQSCFLQQVTINGDLTVVNSEKFTIQNSNVSGAIRVGASGEVRINDTNADRVLVQANERVEVSLTIADTQIRIYQNGSAFVVANASPSINCQGNIRLVGYKNQSSSGNNCANLTDPWWRE